MFSSTKKCLLIKGEKHISEKTALSYILPSIIHICLNAYLRDGDLIRLQVSRKKTVRAYWKASRQHYLTHGGNKANLKPHSD